MDYQWRTCRYAGEMRDGYEDRAIPETISDRSPVPDDVFSYPAVDSWRSRVWTLIADVVTNDVKDHFKRHPPEYVVSDDLTWLNDIVLDVTGQTVDMKELTAVRLADHYRAFRAGHATRTDDLRQFYEGGLRCLRAQDVEERARTLFSADRFSRATEDKLQTAIKEINARDRSGGRKGSLWFCADERGLVARSGHSGHYLVYGGEYLYCLGTYLASISEIQQALKSVGRPTMFICDIPMGRLSPYTLLEFAGSILEYLFCELIDEEAYALSPGAGSGFNLKVDLPGECIVGHYHPTSVYDPLARQAYS